MNCRDDWESVNDELDIYWQQEAMIQRERVRATDEADGFVAPEEEEIWE